MAKRLQDAAIVNTIVPIEKIAPHTANYNIHGDTQLSQLDASHDAFGQYRSTVVWAQADGTYIQVAGHGIVEAMRHKGVKEVRADVLPVETDEATIRAILVADNLHAQNAEPDNDALAMLLREQQEAGFALDALGMTDAQLDELLAALDEPDFEPATEEEQGQLDHKAKVTCPECGATFEPD